MLESRSVRRFALLVVGGYASLVFAGCVDDARTGDTVSLIFRLDVAPNSPYTNLTEISSQTLVRLTIHIGGTEPTEPKGLGSGCKNTFECQWTCEPRRDEFAKCDWVKTEGPFEIGAWIESDGPDHLEPRFTRWFPVAPDGELTIFVPEGSRMTDFLLGGTDRPERECPLAIFPAGASPTPLDNLTDVRLEGSLFIPVPVTAGCSEED